MLIFGLAFVFWGAIADAIASPVICRSDNTSCEVTFDNFLLGIDNVHSTEKCRQLCLNNENCKYLTYYEAGSFPLQEICYLFNACKKTVHCEKCVSETFDCQETCGSNSVGPINDSNLIDIVPHVQTEQECKKSCLLNEECKYYTYFLQDDPESSEICFLLAELLEPQEKCESCLSGPGLCSTTSTSITPSTSSTPAPTTSSKNGCALNINGNLHDHFMFDATWNSDNNHSMSIECYGKSTCECEFRAFLVGGGGDYGNTNGVGAGSGYLNYINEKLSLSSQVAQVQVGRFGQASIITFANGLNYTAKPGQDTSGYSGGDGYSGGGAFCNTDFDDCTRTSFNGGTNGGDGEGSSNHISHGKGTGEDVQRYELDNWTISAGEGGKGLVDSGRWYHGGGGGGAVDVDSVGNLSWKNGLPGVVLIEFST